MRGKNAAKSLLSKLRLQQSAANANSHRAAAASSASERAPKRSKEHRDEDAGVEDSDDGDDFETVILDAFDCEFEEAAIDVDDDDKGDARSLLVIQLLQPLDYTE